jgi:hypothetical protein
LNKLTRSSDYRPGELFEIENIPALQFTEDSHLPFRPARGVLPEHLRLELSPNMTVTTLERGPDSFSSPAEMLLVPEESAETVEESEAAVALVFEAKVLKFVAASELCFVPLVLGQLEALVVREVPQPGETLFWGGIFALVVEDAGIRP